MINHKKVKTNGNNLYQIYNLVRGNWNKIIPNYFSSVYGTTRLVVFIIKDILEFLGLTATTEKKEKAYWTYSNILVTIKSKIHYLKKSKILKQ